jgi:hypothetical protein
MYKKIELPVYSILVQLDTKSPSLGSITCDPSLYEICYNCDKRYCSCYVKFLSDDQIKGNAVIDAILSLILAHACAGIDIESPAYLEGIETAFDALVNNC